MFAEERTGPDIGEKGSEQHTRAAQEAYLKHVGILWRLVTESESYKQACKSSRLGRLDLVIANLVPSNYCICTLDWLYLGEGFMLSRSVIERVITCLYLLFCEEEEFQRYLMYAKQKGYRASDRGVSAGHIAVRWRKAGLVDLGADADLKKAVEEFTSKKGKTIPRWRARSLQDMLDYLGKNTTVELIPLCMGFVYIYDDASEALHGTLYGTTFHFRYGWQGRTTPDEVRRSWLTQWADVYGFMSGAISALIEGIGKVAPIDELVDESWAGFVAMAKMLAGKDREGDTGEG
jgi:hypothetical protein